ncbi:hypothetical protein MHYP_G00117990 [Metynnis hypsauchen]
MEIQYHKRVSMHYRLGSLKTHQTLQLHLQLLKPEDTAQATASDCDGDTVSQTCFHALQTGLTEDPSNSSITLTAPVGVLNWLDMTLDLNKHGGWQQGYCYAGAVCFLHRNAKQREKNDKFS